MNWLGWEDRGSFEIWIFFCFWIIEQKSLEIKLKRSVLKSKILTCPSPFYELDSSPRHDLLTTCGKGKTEIVNLQTSRRGQWLRVEWDILT